MITTPSVAVSTSSTRSSSNGRVEVRRGSHQAYTYRQLVELMEAAGFKVSPDAAWTRTMPSLTLVGTRA